MEKSTHEPQVNKDIVTRDARRKLPRFTKIKKLPIEYMIELVEKGNSQAEIAKILGCRRETVNKYLKKEDIAGLEKFRKHEQKVWAYYRRKVLGEIKGEDIKKASLLQKVTAAGIMLDKERIISGKSGEQNTMQINIEHLKIVQNAIGQVGMYEIDKCRGMEEDKAKVKVEVLAPSSKEIIEAAYDKALSE